MLLVNCYAFAQNKITVSGKVTESATGQPVIGASVVVKGSTTGTVTSIDGDFNLSIIPDNAVLTVSFLGMKTVEIPVNGKTNIEIVMDEDSQRLDEVVVVGYGTAKAKDLTSPIATVKGEEVSKHLTASPMQGLQGKIPGLQVVNKGQPGESPKVRIRGVGNYDKDKQGPLFVVDGMFFDNIDFLNNNDIENISVLKDASASAIYGVRAANGVVLVTTKKGLTNTKPQITYDGYVGFQKAANVIKMADSNQYTAMMTEIGNTNEINQSISKYGGNNGIPSVNTDWYDEILRVAPMQSHSLGITGGGEKTSYSIGVSYLDQEGILDTDNGFNRVNVRSRIDAGITNWLKVGANVVLISSTQDLGNMSAFGNAFTSPSIYPVYDENNTDATPTKYGSAQGIGLSNYFWNPVALSDYYNETLRTAQILPSYYIELSFLQNKLTFKSSFNQDLSFKRKQKFNPTYVVSSTQQNTKSLLEKTQTYTNNWLVDNVLTYRDILAEKHGFTLMAGNSVRKDRWERTFLAAEDVPEGREEYWYIYQGILKNPDKTDKEKYIDNAEEYRGLSYFGRLMYDYSGKYLLSATFRADGSSKYQEKWGYFPSVGLGWVVTEEDFMKNQSVLNFLKIRGSWGILGNDKIPANDGFGSITLQDAIFNNMVVPGYTSVSFYTDLKWEKVEELDFGLDFATLNNRLSGEIDVYQRTTKNAVFLKTLSYGAGSLLMNNGEIKNKGIELTLNWNDRINKDFSYNVGFNLTSLKNEVSYLDGLDRIITPGDFSRIRQIGEPMDAYFGYVMDGIYQSQEEINADKTLEGLTSKPSPGDIRYKDLDGDGKLTDQDRTVLGSHLPDLFIGGNIGFNYKNLDFSMAFTGQFGYEIINAKRLNRQKQTNINFDKNLVENRWTGKGSTNESPSAKGLASTWNYSKFNSFFVESGNTFSIQNIQLGYTFKELFKSKSKLRLSITAERPFTYFTYNGFTTDIEDGIDSQLYPFASTYSLGVRFDF